MEVMKDNDIKWSDFCLCSIQYSEDLWHVKAILCGLHEKKESELYEVEFRDCNIEQLEMRGDSMMFPIKEFIQRQNSNGSYKITISFSSVLGGQIKLSCSDFNVKAITGTVIEVNPESWTQLKGSR
jgi:hypothetical protein